MTEEKQNEVIRESAKAPRDEAANEFLEEQAGGTSARRGKREQRWTSAPGRARTCNHRLRRPVLYPVELQARVCAHNKLDDSSPFPPRRSEVGRLEMKG
jgi:hypothetical protein